MSENLKPAIRKICQACGNDRARMMDIVREVQTQFGCVPSEAMNLIAQETDTPRVEVESVVSFYAFYYDKPKGKVIIRLCNDIIDRMKGSARSAQAFFDDLGIGFGETTPDGNFSLESVPCIGMSDQAPAALINDVVVTNLSSDAAHDVVEQLKKHMDPHRLVQNIGAGNNAHPLVQSMVMNNIRKRGPVIFGDGDLDGEFGCKDGLEKALAMNPAEVIREVKTARLRGRGGAGFPTGMKWEFTRAAEGSRKFMICNADEGEPGTFKDRVILTERPDRLIEGMTIGAYAIGADTGILYLRSEYAYLKAFLEQILQLRRDKGLLGDKILGKDFNFDIRIQMGAGAYVCGEETALISSCEGLRGDPKNRPPFPAQKGYLGFPTSVNNVETFCCVSRILEHGSGWFSQLGSKGSTGTKLLSVSGDCSMPGVFEVPFGIKLKDVIDMAGARDPVAVVVGGPSGAIVGPADYERTICYDDLATGGSVMIFGPDRDVLKIVELFLEFFVEESCGYCTPCRVGNVLMKERIERIMNGKGEPGDLGYLESLAVTIKKTSRCGLGQTSPNPVLTTLKNFRPVYNTPVQADPNGFQRSFDLDAELTQAREIRGIASDTAH